VHGFCHRRARFFNAGVSSYWSASVKRFFVDSAAPLMGGLWTMTLIEFSFDLDVLGSGRESTSSRARVTPTGDEVVLCTDGRRARWLWSCSRVFRSRHRVHVPACAPLPASRIHGRTSVRETFREPITLCRLSHALSAFMSSLLFSLRQQPRVGVPGSVSRLVSALA